jgi:hypothetical protein
MSFSQFVTACITLVFSQSGHRAVSDDFDTSSVNYKQNCVHIDELVAKHGHRFELLFSDFFKFIEHQTMLLDKYKKLPKYWNYDTLYDRMYDNFEVFVNFALKHIIVLDVETLYSGMATQLNKFMKGYEHAFSESMDYLSINISYDFTYPRISSFSEIVFHSHELDYWRKHDQEQYEYLYEYEPDEDNVDLKNLNADNRLQKVQGHRQDYEQHLFNKGLNKKKRERGHIPHKSHKNKSSFKL